MSEVAPQDVAQEAIPGAVAAAAAAGDVPPDAGTGSHVANLYAPTAGTILEYAAPGTTPTYTRIANVDDFSGLPATDAEKIDITRVDQTDGSGNLNLVKAYTPGWDEPGTAQIMVGCDKTVIGTLYGLRRISKLWRVTFTDGTSMVWTGYIQKIEPKAEKAGEVKFTLNMQLTSDVIVTPGS